MADKQKVFGGEIQTRTIIQPEPAFEKSETGSEVNNTDNEIGFMDRVVKAASDMKAATVKMYDEYGRPIIDGK